MWEGSSDTCSAFCVEQEKMYNDVLDDVAFKVRYGGERREGEWGGRVGRESGEGEWKERVGRESEEGEQ